MFVNAGILILIPMIIQIATSRLSCPYSEDASKEAARAVNHLGVELYRTITSLKSEQNVVLSPVSIALSLALLSSGTAGETKSEIQRSLTTPSAARLVSTESFQVLQYDLQDMEISSAKLNIVNGFFYASNFSLKQEYLEKIKQCIYPDVRKTSYYSNPEGVRQSINQWASNLTAQTIPELFKDGTFNRETMAAMATTVYMKGEWVERFREIENLPFYEKGKPYEAKTVPFMVRQDWYAYQTTDHLHVIGIPYMSIPFRMYIILPKGKDGMLVIEQAMTIGRLTAEHLSGVMEQARGREIELKLPRFAIRQTLDLTQVLWRIGMRLMFSGAGDFSGMTGNRGMKISDAVHQAYININENGTHVDAVSTIKKLPLSAIKPNGPPIQITVDHPFIFAVVHEPTKAFVYFGKLNSVEDPTVMPEESDFVPEEE